MKKAIGAIAMGLLLPMMAAGQSIGIHFPSDRGNAGLDPGEVAGVGGYAQANWNHGDGGAAAGDNAVGTTDAITSPNAGVLTDSNGDTTSVTVDWTSNGTWNTTNGADTPDAKLMNGYADAINDGGEARVTFSNIPYASYDAVVYFGSDGNDRTGALTDGTTTYSYATYSNDPDGSGGFDQADFVLTDVDAGNPQANYAVFTGLSGSSWSVDVLRGSSNSGIHGVQIVNVPEPATCGLLGVAILGLLSRRRRR